MSKTNFPPKTKNEDQVVSMLEVLCSVIPDKNSVYISIPLTSGKRFIDWNSKVTVEENKQEKVLSNVIENNKRSAKTIVGNLRNKFSEILIDPLALPDIKGWDQDDYRDFWGRVVERYAKTVVCTNDWNYSSGCSYEFLVAKQNKIFTVDENINFISTEEGIEQINMAIEEMESCKLPTCFLENVVNELTKIKVEETVCSN